MQQLRINTNVTLPNFAFYAVPLLACRSPLQKKKKLSSHDPTRHSTTSLRTTSRRARVHVVSLNCLFDIFPKFLSTALHRIRSGTRPLEARSRRVIPGPVWRGRLSASVRTTNCTMVKEGPHLPV